MSSRPGTAAVDREALSSTVDSLSGVADRLALALRVQWEREERLQGVHDPFPLPVRWHRVADRLVDHWPNIQRAPAGSRR
jgi:hypothetical protein